MAVFETKVIEHECPDCGVRFSKTWPAGILVHKIRRCQECRSAIAERQKEANERKYQAWQKSASGHEKPGGGGK